jgi:GT2 family glycosyltransferase
VASVSVVIPVRNRARTLARQLEALASQQGVAAFQVVVGDHGSTDDTVAVARSFAPRFAGLEVVDATGAAGSPGVRNRAVAAAAGELLAFCDSDDVVHPAWLARLLAPLDERACVVGGRRLFLREGTPVPPPDEWAPTRPHETYMSHLGFADTCSMAVRAGDLRSVGCFDVRFTKSSDVDCSWRLQEAGVPYVWVPDALVAKFVPAGAAQRWRKYVEWGQYQPLLYRVHRAAGVPRRGVRGAAMEVAHLARLVPRAVRDEPNARDDLLVRSGMQAGRWIGAMRFRTLYL